VFTWFRFFGLFWLVCVVFGCCGFMGLWFTFVTCEARFCSLYVRFAGFCLSCGGWFIIVLVD